MPRFSAAEHQAFVESFHRDGFVVLRDHFPKAKIHAWNEAFRPLLDEAVAREGAAVRGSARYYVTLPFEGRWADPTFHDDDDVMAIVSLLVGEDGVMCQLATDTPCLGSDYQDVHRDTPPLFPEWGRETPSYQLAVNFPLVDVVAENGPIEIAPGTHRMSKEEALAKLASGEITLNPYPLAAGDVMIRDVRGLHRGTPNRTEVPRPMVVIGYSRRWLYRPEVSVTIPRTTWDDVLSERSKRWLRFNAVVDAVDGAGTEAYQAFAY